MSSHVLQTGFITKGAAIRPARALGNKALFDCIGSALNTVDRNERVAPCNEKPVTCPFEGGKIEVWLSKSDLYYFRVTYGAIGLFSWLSRCCVNCQLWEHPCVLWARGGTTGQTTMKIAMAILAIELCPGGTNLSPMLIDQAQDGEFR